MKRRLYLITNDYPNRGGDANFIRYEVVKLREEFDVVNICLSGKSEDVKEFAGDTFFFGYSAGAIFKYIPKFFVNSLGVQEIRSILKSTGSLALRVRRMISSARVFAGSEWFMKKVEPIIKDAPEDAIVYTYWNDYATLGFLRMKEKHPDFRYISRIHGCDLYDERVPSLRQPFKWFMNGNIDKLVFIGSNSMDYYIQRHPELKHDKYELCRLGVEPADDVPVAEHKEFIIVSCSRMIPLKRVNLITEALSKCNFSQHVRWVHFGDGELLESEKSNADKLLSSIDNISFEFAGNTDNKAIRDYYSANKPGCFITTSSTEGCPVSVMEAMAAGIPVIGTAVGDIPFMIEGNGVLLDAKPSVDEIAKAIECIAKAYADRHSDDSFENMCIGSKKIYNDRFNVQRNTEHFIYDILMD